MNCMEISSKLIKCFGELQASSPGDDPMCKGVVMQGRAPTLLF